MAVQWTVSFERGSVDPMVLKVLEGYEYERYQKNGQDRIDMSEEEFFSFAEEVEDHGLSLPTDGSDSWGKHV